MGSTLYIIVITLHTIAAAIAIGAVTVTDYLHIVGLRKRKLEKKLSEIYPNLSDIIVYTLIFLFLSGFAMVYLNQALLKSPFFLTKAILVILVSANGLYLQKKVEPNLNKCVMKGTKHCSRSLLYSSAIFGSFSVVTWYSILILSMTKTTGYTLKTFLTIYFIVLSIAMISAYFLEKKSRVWRED